MDAKANFITNENKNTLPDCTWDKAYQIKNVSLAFNMNVDAKNDEVMKVRTSVRRHEMHVRNVTEFPSVVAVGI